MTEKWAPPKRKKPWDLGACFAVAAAIVLVPCAIIVAFLPDAPAGTPVTTTTTTTQPKIDPDAQVRGMKAKIEVLWDDQTRAQHIAICNLWMSDPATAREAFRGEDDPQTEGLEWQAMVQVLIERCP